MGAERRMVIGEGVGGGEDEEKVRGQSPPSPGWSKVHGNLPEAASAVPVPLSPPPPLSLSLSPRPVSPRAPAVLTSARHTAVQRVSV